MCKRIQQLIFIPAWLLFWAGEIDGLQVRCLRRRSDADSHQHRQEGGEEARQARLPWRARVFPNLT